MAIAAPDGRLAGLDTLRAVAITIVIIFHLQQYLPAALHPIAGVGWMGVDLFFVLSGYLIGGQILKRYATGRGANFAVVYARRAYRILPAYLVILLLYLLVPAWREWPGLAAWWKFLSFTEISSSTIRRTWRSRTRGLCAWRSTSTCCFHSLWLG